MKNITCVSHLQSCICCNAKGFFCYTPRGADFTSCPCCGEYDFLNKTLEVSSHESKYYFLLEDEYERDMRNEFRYCNKCNFIFKIGCTHSLIGCTDSVYNGHFIKKWKHKKAPFVEYNGMPQFENNDDWFNNVNDVEVLEMFCPHKNNHCLKSPHVNNGCCFIINNL